MITSANKQQHILYCQHGLLILAVEFTLNSNWGKTMETVLSNDPEVPKALVRCIRAGNYRGLEGLRKDVRQNLGKVNDRTNIMVVISGHMSVQDGELEVLADARPFLAAGDKDGAGKSKAGDDDAADKLDAGAKGQGDDDDDDDDDGTKHETATLRAKWRVEAVLVTVMGALNEGYLEVPELKHKAAGKEVTSVAAAGPRPRGLLRGVFLSGCSSMSSDVVMNKMRERVPPQAWIAGFAHDITWFPSFFQELIFHREVLADPTVIPKARGIIRVMPPTACKSTHCFLYVSFFSVHLTYAFLLLLFFFLFTYHNSSTTGGQRSIWQETRQAIRDQQHQ